MAVTATPDQLEGSFGEVLGRALTWSAIVTGSKSQ